MQPLCLLLLLVTLALANGQGCKVIKVRKEIGDLSWNELNTLKRAIIKLRNSGQYEDYEIKHLVNSHKIHNSSQFFPWHRVFVNEYEEHLRLFEPNVVLPYWDVSDSR
jgi:tyrosinase